MDNPGEALRAAAAVGPYFVWTPWSPDAGWRPIADLADPAVAAERVAAARQTLITMFALPDAAVPDRVVASVTFLGLASRLLSPALAAHALTGVFPVADLWWQPTAGGPWPIAYRAARAGAPGLTAVEPVLATFRAAFALSPKVLWGNVASALAGAAGMLPAGEPRTRAYGIVGDLLAGPPLRGMARLAPGGVLTRNNCCLYYRIPGGGICGDCVLARPAR